MTAEITATSDPSEFRVGLSGVLTCSATFSGPIKDSLSIAQFPRLTMTLAGSLVDLEMAPLNYTYQQPMHYLVRVCVNAMFPVSVCELHQYLLPMVVTANEKVISDNQ